MAAATAAAVGVAMGEGAGRLSQPTHTWKHRIDSWFAGNVPSIHTGSIMTIALPALRCGC